MTTAHDLSRRLADLLRREHEAMADFLVLLADFDRRRAWAELGYANLFQFLSRELRLSNGAAHFRKVAADLVGRFPEVEAALRDGRLCISSVVELAKVITPENRGDVLPRFFHMSRREAMVVAAELKPVESPPLRDVVAPVPAASVTAFVELRKAEAPGAASRSVAESGRPSGSVLLVEQVDASFTMGRCGLSSRLDDRGPRSDATPRSSDVTQRSDVTPLSAEQFRLHFTVSRRVHEKLQAARGALSHSKPNASLEEILEAGLDLVLAADAKRKALVSKPRKTPPSTSSVSPSDHVPAHVRREVWQRDGGRCQVRLASGELCGSSYQVELGHFAIPRALGGPATVDNLRCECRGHNQLQAERDFGEAFMARARARGRAAREPESAAPGP